MRRPHLVHQALGVEQRGAGNGVHLQRVASVGKQELRADESQEPKVRGEGRPRPVPSGPARGGHTDLVDRMTERQLT